MRTLDDVIEQADVVITATGNRDIVTVEQMRRMKHNAVLGNIGHFDNEIDMAGLAAVPGIERVTIKPQVDQWVFPDGHAIIVLSEGRLLNLGNATGPPELRDVATPSRTRRSRRSSCSRMRTSYPIGVHVLPKQLDEKVARLHVEALGAKLTELRAEQAAYIGVPVEGPYKPDQYRY